MTEAEWLECSEPRRLIDHLRSVGKASERKCRLLMCALARSFWAHLPDTRSRIAVEAAEVFAEGFLGADTLQMAANLARLAHDEAREAFIAAHRASGGKMRQQVKEASVTADASAVAAWAAADHPLGFWSTVTEPSGDPLDFYDENLSVNHLLEQRLPLLHDQFGNPFSPACLDPDWLMWENGTVVKLAQMIHDNQLFGDMPVLADALEDAGCLEEEILEHLRETREHGLGCWVVDEILGKS